MKVKSITPAGTADVFNMEVDGTHDFVIQGGVVSHNCADESRYFCMTRPISPRRSAKSDDYDKNPASVYLDIPKEDLGKRKKVPHFEIIGGNDGIK